MSNYSKIRYFYLRDSKRVPHSCIAVRLDRDTNTIQYQLSTMSSKENKHGKAITFNKQMARFITCQRLDKHPINMKLSFAQANAHEITRLIMDHIVSQADYWTADPKLLKNNELDVPDLTFVRGFPQRARTAAKQWLKKHVEQHPTVPSIKVSNYSVSDVLGIKNENLMKSMDDQWDAFPLTNKVCVDEQAEMCVSE